MSEPKQGERVQEVSEPSATEGQRSGQAAPSAGHELTDVEFGPILKFGTALAVFAAFVLVVVWLLFGYFDTRETDLKRSEYPLAEGERGRQPPAPRLEGINLEYAKGRARLDATKAPSLKPGQAIAIDHAMRQLEHSLPVRTDATGVVPRSPSDSNSGRELSQESL